MCNYELKWNTVSSCSVHDLLRDDILNELGIDSDDIVKESIQPSISTPTIPYVVPGLAKPGHELCISGGISFQTKNTFIHKNNTNRFIQFNRNIIHVLKF